MRTQETHDLKGKFFDYMDDKEALEEEDAIASTLLQSGPLFHDISFPANGVSLYRTPQQPPRGAMPPALVRWGRVCHLEIRGCYSPVTFPKEGLPLCGISQGALGNIWLVSAFNILISSPHTLRHVIVSERHKDKGLFTLKLFKEGQWRYMHLDDCFPCSYAGMLHYFTNKKSRQPPPSPSPPSKIWGPLIEKAFAKLYGCYESLGRRSIEEGLRCITGVLLLRMNL
ncbi:unnamed protein product, partial [Choristocarpus tenellus]